MGRTIPSFRIASVMEKMNGNHFESVLDKSDRKVFDRVFSIAHLYNTA
jgi:L-fucose isomerase-like protein